jgi:hypothetical protein
MSMSCKTIFFFDVEGHAEMSMNCKETENLIDFDVES